MSNTLRSWWRRGRDDHLDAAGVVAGRLLAALELSSEAAAAAVVRRRRSCLLCHRQRRRRPNLLRSTAKTTAKARAWWRPCPDVVWYGRRGGCAVRRRPENSGGVGGGAGRGERVKRWEREGLLVSPTGGPWGKGGQGRASRSSARVRFTPNRAQVWAGDGSKTDGIRTFVRLRPRAGPPLLSLLPQTDGDEQDRVARWSWP